MNTRWTYSDALTILLCCDEDGLALEILSELSHDLYSVTPNVYAVSR